MRKEYMVVQYSTRKDGGVVGEEVVKYSVTLLLLFILFAPSYLLRWISLFSECVVNVTLSNN